MMISSGKNDVGCGLKDTDINGLSDLYFPQEDKGLTTIEEVLHVTDVYGRDEEEIFVENAA